MEIIKEGRTDFENIYRIKGARNFVFDYGPGIKS